MHSITGPYTCSSGSSFSSEKEWCPARHPYKRLSALSFSSFHFLVLFFLLYQSSAAYPPCGAYCSLCCAKKGGVVATGSEPLRCATGKWSGQGDRYTRADKRAGACIYRQPQEGPQSSEGCSQASDSSGRGSPKPQYKASSTVPVQDDKAATTLSGWELALTLTSNYRQEHHACPRLSYGELSGPPVMQTGMVVVVSLSQHNGCVTRFFGSTGGPLLAAPRMKRWGPLKCHLGSHHSSAGGSGSCQYQTWMP